LIYPACSTSCPVRLMCFGFPFNNRWQCLLIVVSGFDMMLLECFFLVMRPWETNGGFWSLPVMWEAYSCSLVWWAVSPQHFRSYTTLSELWLGMKTDGIFSVPFHFIFYIFSSVSVFVRFCFRISGSRKWCNGVFRSFWVIPF
jgi:hypothetical protein